MSKPNVYDVKKINSVTRSIGNTQAAISYVTKGAVFFALKDKNADPAIRVFDALKNAKFGSKAKQFAFWLAENFGVCLTVTDGKTEVSWGSDYAKRDAVASQAAADAFELAIIPKPVSLAEPTEPLNADSEEVESDIESAIESGEPPTVVTLLAQFAALADQLRLQGVTEETLQAALLCK